MSHRFTPPPSSTLTVLTLLAIGPCSPAWAADGGIDLGFGTNGIVSTPINSRALAIQADGRIVVVGDTNGDFGVVRYNADGSLDVTFGQGGIVHTDWGATTLPVRWWSQPTARSWSAAPDWCATTRTVHSTLASAPVASSRVCQRTTSRFGRMGRS